MKKKDSGLALFTALGDPTRYGLVCSLLGGEKCACELPALVGRAQPTVSLQLKLLVKNGVLTARRDGRKVLYSLRDARVRRIMAISRGK